MKRFFHALILLSYATTGGVARGAEPLPFERRSGDLSDCLNGGSPDSAESHPPTGANDVHLPTIIDEVDFIKEFGDKKERTTDAENRDYVDAMTKTHPAGTMFVTRIRAFLKEMNDNGFNGDKSMADAVFNYKNKLFVDELNQAEFAALRNKITGTSGGKLLGQFSDYKKLEAAYADFTPADRALWEKLVTQHGVIFSHWASTQRFRRADGQVRLLVDYMGRKGSLINDPRSWELVAIGRSPAWATMTAKIMRRLPNWQAIAMDHEVIPDVKEILLRLNNGILHVPESLRRNKGLLDDRDGPPPLLSERALNILRKVKTEEPTFDAYVKELRKEFGLVSGWSLSPDHATAAREARWLQSMYDLSDIFAPENYTLPDHVDPADHHRVSTAGLGFADWTRLGARNAHAVLRATVLTPDQSRELERDQHPESIIQHVLDRAKREVDRVTEKLDDDKRGLVADVLSVDPNAVAKPSGDDATIYWSRELNTAQKLKFLELQARRRSLTRRHVFQGQNYGPDGKGGVIPEQVRKFLGSQGEKIEKDMDRYAGQLGSDRYDQTARAIEIVPDGHGGGTVNLYLAGNDARDPSWRTALQSLMADALERMNNPQNTRPPPPKKYLVGDIHFQGEPLPESHAPAHKPARSSSPPKRRPPETHSFKLPFVIPWLYGYSPQSIQRVTYL